MSETERKVAKAYPNDAGRGIIRVDPDALVELDLSPGNIVALEGSETTGVKVWRADHEDWESDTIGIDRFTRQNAGVSIGDSVSHW